MYFGRYISDTSNVDPYHKSFVIRLPSEVVTISNRYNSIVGYLDLALEYNSIGLCLHIAIIYMSTI